MLERRTSRWRTTSVAITAALVSALLAACGSSTAPSATTGSTGSTTSTLPASTTAPASTTTTTIYPAVTVPPRAEQFAVGTRYVTFVDTSRHTPKSSAVPGGRPTRTLHTQIWYPRPGPTSNRDVKDAPAATMGGPFPLVVFGHGFTHSASHYEGLLHKWAAAGYVIAGPDLPSSSSHEQGHPSDIDENMEPGDLSFVATSVLRLNGTPGSWLQGVVNAHELVFAGHSQGALDAFASVFADCCRDTRITAAVILAGGLDDPGVYGHYTWSRPHPPVLIEQGNADDVVSLDNEVRPTFAELRPVAMLLVLGGAHDGTYEGDANGYPTRLAAEAAIDFADRYAKGDARAAARLAADVARTGATLTSR